MGLQNFTGDIQDWQKNVSAFNEEKVPCGFFVGDFKQNPYVINIQKIPRQLLDKISHNYLLGGF